MVIKCHTAHHKRHPREYIVTDGYEAATSIINSVVEMTPFITGTVHFMILS